MNILNLQALLIPANSFVMLKVLDHVTNFNIMKMQLVQDFVKDNLSPSLKTIYSWVEEVGELIVMTAAVLALVALISLLLFVLKKNSWLSKKLQTLRQSFMFNGLIRVVDQQYLP